MCFAGSLATRVPSDSASKLAGETQRNRGSSTADLHSEEKATERVAVFRQTSQLFSEDVMKK